MHTRVRVHTVFFFVGCLFYLCVSVYRTNDSSVLTDEQQQQQQQQQQPRQSRIQIAVILDH